jgi:ribose 5-phosphate isomerase RpiB
VPSIHLNNICHGGIVVGYAVAWKLAQTFLTAQFSRAECHRRGLSKAAELEMQDAPDE